MSNALVHKIEQAAISAARVFGYVAAGSLLTTLSPLGTDGVPSLHTLHDAGLTAAYAGGIATVGFVYNLLRPRVAAPPAGN